MVTKLGVLIEAQQKGFEFVRKSMDMLAQNIQKNQKINRSQSSILANNIRLRQEEATNLRMLGSVFESTTDTVSRFNKELVQSGRAAANSFIKNQQSIREQTSNLATSINERYSGIGTSFQRLGGYGQNQIRTFDGMSESAQGFQFELLGVMFFGMSLQRTFNGLIKTSMEWMGITDLLGQTLGVFFLPIAEDLLNILFPIMEWMMDMPESTRRVIGVMVVLGSVIGGALFVIGQLGLGLASLKMMNFGQTAANITGIGNSANTAKGKVSGLKGILKGVGTAIAITAAITFAFKGMKEEQISKSLQDFFISGISAGIAALLVGASLPAAITVGALTFLVLAEIKFKWMEKTGNWIREKVQNTIDEVESSFEMFKEGVPLKDIFGGQEPTDIVYDANLGVVDTRKNIDKMNRLKKWGRDPFTGEKIEEVEDFILQPGGRLIKTDMNDTIIGSKNGFGGNVNLNVTYNVNVSDKKEFESMLERNNRKMVNETRRLVNT